MNATQPKGPPYLLQPVMCQQQAESRRMILAAAQAARPRQALVVGAGRAAEIPLAELANRFECLVINDVRTDELDAGIAAAGIDSGDRTKLKLDASDLTGVTQPLLNECEACLRQAPDPQAAGSLLAALTDRWPDGNMGLPGTFDLVVASCVLSQLHFGLSQGVLERFEARFPGQGESLRANPAWSAALYRRARRMEARFVDNIHQRLSPGAWWYLSESVQMCHFDVTPDGRWSTAGSLSMLASKDLSSYLDQRFAIVSRATWPWVVWMNEAHTAGRLFDVQAIVARPV